MTNLVNSNTLITNLINWRWNMKQRILNLIAEIEDISDSLERSIAGRNTEQEISMTLDESALLLDYTTEVFNELTDAMTDLEWDK